MKVELSIKDDAELRNLIKDMIKGQVKTVAREEIVNILKESIQESTGKPKTIDDFIKNTVQNELKSSFYGRNYIKEKAAEFILKEVNEQLKEYKLSIGFGSK